MKTIRLDLHDEFFAAVRSYAAEHDTSVRALVREFLIKLANQGDDARKARVRMKELSSRSEASLGRKSWNRQELHDRKAPS